MSTTRLDPHCIAEARERALRLRDEAVDATWSALEDHLARQRDQAARAARRWAYRLARHLERRAAGHRAAP